jgi:hypothetical protein
MLAVFVACGEQDPDSRLLHFGHAGEGNTVRRPLRKIDAGDEQLDALGRLQRVERLHAAGENLDLVAGRLHGRGHIFPEIGVIMDQDDTCGHRFLPIRRPM